MSLNKSIIICITGPESSGKTTLSQSFIDTHQITVVSEYARTYLNNLNRAYVQSDLELIAREQLNRIKFANSSVIITDTGVEVVKIWNDEKFGKSEVIENLLQEQLQLVDSYWLCKPDIPWKPDSLRENPHDRARLFKSYQNLLTKLDQPFKILKGNQQERSLEAIEYLEHKKTLSL